MQTYHLADEFTDTAAEQTLLASLAAAPARYWELLDGLTADLFPYHLKNSGLKAPALTDCHDKGKLA